jgi:hypothetical protein
MPPRLFHFSDDETIERFQPRPVKVPSQRAVGREWLNGPLVWAIDEWHQPMYLFPRDCPRVLMWRTPETSESDALRYLGASRKRIVAYVERGWLDALGAQILHRYELPGRSFEPLNDAGMWVSRVGVDPIARTELSDLPARLGESDVELRVIETLTTLRDAWQSSLHVSGIRLRNASGWTIGA